MLLQYYVIAILCYCNIMLLGYYVIRVLCHYTIAISQQILFYIQTDYQYITSFLKQRIQPCSSNLHTII